MYIYSVSVKLLPEIEQDWLRWMHEEHMQAVLNTGCFYRYHLFQLSEPIDEEGITYIAQYESETMEAIDTYIEQFAPALRQDGYTRFGDQFIAFRTILQHVVSSNSLK
ncbi:MAG: DUF4286 family protein [Chitinophagaceae bacterium]